MTERTPGLAATTGESPVDPPPTIAQFLESVIDPTPEERLQLVDRAITLIAQIYVHLPLKRAMHAIDPIQHLQLLRLRAQAMTGRDFHAELASVFLSLHDLHTRYIFPASYQGRSAFLPFLVEEYFEGSGTRRFIVSKVFGSVEREDFKPGVILTHWNGTPIDRAVAINAAKQAGSNTDASHARGLEAMTIRPLFLGPPPDEEWIEVRYQPEGDGHAQEIRLGWQLFVSANAPHTPASDTAAITRQEKGIDIQSEAVRQVKAVLLATGDSNSGVTANLTTGVDLQTAAVQQVKKTLFAPAVGTDEAEMARRAAAPAAAIPEGKSLMPGQYAYRTVDTPSGTFGYIRIFSFSPPFLTSPDEFAREFARMASLLPQTGLILDIRANPGGNILAAERLLQILTPRTIKAERFQLRNTSRTLELSDAPGVVLGQWKESIASAIMTGETYSQAFPLAGDDSFNQLGQRYQGPIVVITDALCYSASDIFVAGFQDHEIGPVLGTSAHTGAGGANMWEYDFLRSALPQQFTPLPKGASFTVSVRRSTRIGKRAGVTLEDLGVVPEHIHQMTRDDVLLANIDLINHAGRLLATQTHHSLAYKIEREDPSTVAVATTNIDRVDVYIGNRPLLSLDIANGDGQFLLPAALRRPISIELRGFQLGIFVSSLKFTF